MNLHLSIKGTGIFQILVLIGLLLNCLPALSQDYSYYYQGKKVFYKTSTSKMLVRFKDNSNSEERRAAITSQNIFQSFREVSSVSGLYILDIDNKFSTAAEFESKITNFKNNSNISYSSPFLINSEGREIGSLTDEFVVKLKESSNFSQLELLANKYKVTIVKQYEFDQFTFFLSSGAVADKNVMELSKIFFESGIFDFAEPNFLIFNAQGTDDTFYNDQWALRNTGQNGGSVDADMDVPEAWGITTGCTSVRIAVLDSGVELLHPDLNGNLLAGFDATGTGGSGGATGSNNHGTACAGIIAAEGNNSQGVAGVSYSSRIVPVKVLNDATQDDDVTALSWLATGIDWAWTNNRADVISLSLGVHVNSQLVTDAINRATTQGRNNLGCIVLAISHNDGTSKLRFPARLSNVIAVGATDNKDKRASFSNFGTGLDVVAPGVNIYTTDRQGSIGKNIASGTNGDYYGGFTGTSAACPNAAGVVALILSVNPSLTQIQARQILESTTDKVSGYTYSSNVSGQPNGTWDTEVGYGRINALKAVQAAVPFQITGTSLFCTNSTYSISNLPSGASVTWQASPAGVVSINTSSNQATLTKLTNGYITLTATITSSCISRTLTKKITVGIPPIDFVSFTNPVGGEWYWCSSDYGNTFAVYPSLPNVTYEAKLLSWPSMAVVRTNSNASPGSDPFGYVPTGWYVFQIRAKNACGTSAWYETEVEYVDCSNYESGENFSISASPNPTDGDLDIVLDNEKPEVKALSKNEKVIYVLYDLNQAKEVKSWTLDNNQNHQRLNVRGIKPGHYILVVTKGKYRQSTQIIVK